MDVEVPSNVIEPDVLEKAIRDSWCQETSDDPAEWSAHNPARGQCWVTAFVVREFMGGAVVVADVVPHTDPIERHAWNVLPGGGVLDLTGSQFPHGQRYEVRDISEDRLFAFAGKRAHKLLSSVKEKLTTAS